MGSSLHGGYIKTYAVLSVLTLTFLSGCGRGNTVDAAFVSYVEDYKRETLIQTGKAVDIKSDIVFGETPVGVVGYCQTSTDNGLKITISPSHWEAFDEYKRRWLMFHELGHCEMDMEHRGEYDGDKYTSLMYPYIGPSRMYQEHYDYYNRELYEPLLF